MCYATCGRLLLIVDICEVVLEGILYWYGWPTRAVFENSKYASKGKPVLRVIQFSDVKSISSSNINKHQKKLIVVVVCNGDDFLFFVKSEDEHAKWLGYCNVLFTLPNYIIPEIPKRNLVSKECAKKYTDPSKFGAGKHMLAM